MNLRVTMILLMLMALCPVGHAAEPDGPAARWTQFAKALENLHEQRIQTLDHVTRESSGGYGGIRANPDFYHEVKYIDPESGNVLAIVQREKQSPNLLHVIELYIYDDRGRLAREYLATYLPGRRETPFQTLITLYAYEDKLKAFRQFDASDDLLFEYCAGEQDGNQVRIAWDELELPDSISEIKDDGIRNAYRQCFQSLSRSAGSYLDPLYELK